VLPARELLADLLADADDPAAAAVEYRRVLDAAPGRRRAAHALARLAAR
jgi:hypothetical protein